MTEIVNGNKLLEVLIGNLFCLCFVVCLLCPILFWCPPMEINEMRTLSFTTMPVQFNSKDRTTPSYSTTILTF